MGLKFYGEASNVANGIIRCFENGNVPEALSQVFISGCADKHIAKYSYMNRFIVAMHGYSDARGLKQWKKLGRRVKNEEFYKPVIILAPVLKTYWKENEVTGKKEKRQWLVGFKGVRVYGYEQTEGKPLETDPTVGEFLESLPLLNVAKAWGLEVEAYNGDENGALGFYAYGNGIGLGVKNLSTWAHELAHAADDRLGSLKSERNRAIGEVVAEFAGAVLLKTLGKETEADLGGAFEYIKTWAAREDLSVPDACYKVVDRVCKVVAHILEESEKLEAAAA